MKISVLTVTYNQIKSLTKLYESLVPQKGYLKEWVVYDDGSVDGTVDFLEGIKDFPIKVIHGVHDNKQLVVGKMNKCMQTMVGGAFILVFGDTWLEQDALKKIAETYVPNSFGAAYRINVTLEGKFLSNDFRIPLANDVREINSRIDEYRALPGNGMITTKEIMERINWIDEGYPGYGMDDADTAMRAKMNGARLFMYNNVKIYHVDHPNKDTTPNNEKRYMDKLHGVGYRYEGKKIKLILDCTNMDVRHLNWLFEYKKEHPSFKVTLLNPFTKEDIVFDWLVMTRKDLPYTHSLVEPYWLCYGDEITVFGKIDDIVGSAFDRLRVREDVEWCLI